jgi:hypothetical protein
MILNPDDYLIQKPAIKQFLDGKKTWNYADQIGKVALYTNLHVVLCAYFIGELYGFTNEIRAHMARLMDFYRIDSITGYTLDKSTPTE